MSNDNDLEEQFHAANAKLGFMAGRLADVLRSCIRAAASNQPRSQIYAAMQSFQTLQMLIARSEGVEDYDLFAEAIKQITVTSAADPMEGLYVDAAKMGMRYLVEKSCPDGAAAGRARNRRSEFKGAMEDIDEARQEKRKALRRPVKR